MIVDTHLHVWSADEYRWPRPGLARHPQPLPTENASTERLITWLDGAGIERAVLVQPTLYGPDHRYLRRALADHPQRLAGIALVDPSATDAVTTLEGLLDAGLAGARIHALGVDAADILRSLPDAILAACVRHRAPLCLHVAPLGHAEIARIAQRWPDLALIVDHLGRLDLGSGDPLAALAALASSPNVFCKVSGLELLSREPPYADAAWALEAALDAFGRERLLWGSNFPYGFAPGSNGDAARSPGFAEIPADTALALFWRERA